MAASRPDRDRLKDQADYEGTPFLTGLANFCAAVGLLVGGYAAIGLAAEWDRGIGATLPLIGILAAIVVVNATLQAMRWRRRRHQGLSRAWRRYRNGLGPRPPGPAPRASESPSGRARPRRAGWWSDSRAADQIQRPDGRVGTSAA
jgi:hypothetical protein